MLVINYFFEKHLERCKKELENFENNRFKDIREDLKAEAKQYINGAKNFFGSIDAENYSDFYKFNGMIKTFNDELNRIMKVSANMIFIHIQILLVVFLMMKINLTMQVKEISRI